MSSPVHYCCMHVETLCNMEITYIQEKTFGLRCKYLLSRRTHDTQAVHIPAAAPSLNIAKGSPDLYTTAAHQNVPNNNDCQTFKKTISLSDTCGTVIFFFPLGFLLFPLIVGIITSFFFLFHLKSFCWSIVDLQCSFSFRCTEK